MARPDRRLRTSNRCRTASGTTTRIRSRPASWLSTGDLRDPTITLGARDYTACLGASVPDMGQSSLYRFSLEARKLDSRDPKFCLYSRGPDSCQKLPAGRAVGRLDAVRRSGQSERQGGRDTGLPVRPTRPGWPGAGGSSTGRSGSIRWPPSAVVLVRQPEGKRAANLMAGRTIRAESTPINPARTDVRVEAGAAVVALTQTNAPGWNLTGFGKSSATQGWMASWVVDGQAVDGSARYLPLIEEPLGPVPPADSRGRRLPRHMGRGHSGADAGEVRADG